LPRNDRRGSVELRSPKYSGPGWAKQSLLRRKGATETRRYRRYTEQKRQ